MRQCYGLEKASTTFPGVPPSTAYPDPTITMPSATMAPSELIDPPRDFTPFTVSNSRWVSKRPEKSAVCRRDSMQRAGSRALQHYAWEGRRGRAVTDTGLHGVQPKAIAGGEVERAHAATGQPEVHRILVECGAPENATRGRNAGLRLVSHDGPAGIHAPHQFAFLVWIERQHVAGLGDHDDAAAAVAKFHQHRRGGEYPSPGRPLWDSSRFLSAHIRPGRNRPCAPGTTTARGRYPCSRPSPNRRSRWPDTWWRPRYRSTRRAAPDPPWVNSRLRRLPDPTAARRVNSCAAAWAAGGVTCVSHRRLPVFASSAATPPTDLQHSQVVGRGAELFEGGEGHVQAPILIGGRRRDTRR